MSWSKKNTFTYLLVLTVASIATWAVLQWGDNGIATVPATRPVSAFDSLLSTFKQPFTQLLLQILIILLAANLCAALAQRLGQPRVIGEILAGILLGPSALGWAWPESNAFIFPSYSLVNLQLVSQFGLVLFMFMVGLQLDLHLLKSRASAVVLISHVSVVVPFLLGVLLALVLYDEYAPAGTGFVSFGLFIGIAMSITAFPVLARILQERRLAHGALGSLALACAAIDDVTAWSLLALVIGLAQAGSASAALITITLTIFYTIVMLALLRPWLQVKFGHIVHADQVHSQSMVLIFTVLLVSAFMAEIIGVHALFGAFLAGVIMPATGALRGVLAARLEHLTGIVLLPLFFAFTGLRTEIGLLDDVQSWLMCAAVIIVAVAGKLGASALAARWTGMRWRDALGLGALLNTRGLMELVVLNIGYDLGVLSAKAFTIFVLMALVTTMMTGPLLNWFKPEQERPR